MTRSINRVTLLGNLGRDAETKFTSGGTAVTNFSVATEHSWKDKQSGEWKKETEWTNVVAFGVENAPLTKGTTVLVEGRLRTRKYEKRDGTQGFSVEVVADSIAVPNVKSEPRQQAAPGPRPVPRQQVADDDEQPF